MNSQGGKRPSNGGSVKAGQRGGGLRCRSCAGRPVSVVARAGLSSYALHCKKTTEKLKNIQQMAPLTLQTNSFLLKAKVGGKCSCKHQRKRSG